MIVAQNRRKRSASHVLSEQFQIGSRTIRKIIKNEKDGVFNHGANGRPPSLDSISQTLIEAWIISLAQTGSQLENESLLGIIKREAFQTLLRRNPNYVHTDGRRKNFLSYKGLKNYQKKFTIFYLLHMNMIFTTLPSM